MVYFRPEGRDEGRMTIRRHRLAERLMMDVLNIRGEDGDFSGTHFWVVRAWGKSSSRRDIWAGVPMEMRIQVGRW